MKVKKERSLFSIKLFIDILNHTLQFVFYKRAICDANILGYHQDSQFYATGDKMVCQFVETACGAEKWNPESSLEPDKVSIWPFSCSW